MATVAASTMLALPALAQSPSSTPATVEKVTVTGSRIKQPNNSAATATSTITSTILEASGEPNAADVIRDLPQTGVSGTSSVNSNFSTTNNGINTINLRNLGEDRTLVLLNGRRMVAGVALSGIVDFNSIPVEMIDRIDIVSGGSSAIYGSDAVAGVVNIITRRDYEGLSANFQWGRPDEYNDADTWRASLFTGGNFADNKGNATFGINFDSAGPAYARSRPDSSIDCLSDAYFGGSALAQTCPFYSGFAEGGRYNFNTPTGSAASVNRALLSTGAIASFSSATQGFNRQAKRLHSVPYEKRGVNGSLSYDFTSDLTVFSEFLWTNTISKSDIEPFPLDSADIFGENVQNGSLNNRRSGVAPDNPFMPRSMLDELCVRWGIAGSLAACQALARPALVTSLMATPDAAVGFQRRMTEIGNRGQDFDSTTTRAVLGIEGKIAHWDYDLSYVYGVTKANQIGGGQINALNFLNALRAVDLNTDADNNPATNPQDVVCADPAARLAGCVPVNIFTTTTVPGNWTQQQINWIKADVFRAQEQTQEVLTFNSTGDVFQNWAGMITGAVGAEYRLEKGRDTPDALSQSGLNGGNVTPPTAGSFDVWEAYAEVDVPLLSDLPFIQSLTAHGATRISEYSTAGKTNAFSGGLNWIVTDGVRLRGQWARAVRAPNIGELYTGASETFATVQDPCNNLEVTLADAAGAPYTNLNAAGPTDDTVIGNCLANPGIFARATAAGGFVLTQPELQGTGGFTQGNAGLEPETSDSRQFGIVVTPDFWGKWFGKLTLSVDYYDFDISDAIGSVSRNETLELCYTSVGLGSPFCNNTPGGPIGFVRDVNGALEEVNTALANVNAIKTSGVDIQLNYGFEVNSLVPVSSDLGSMSLNAQWTHLDTYDFTALAGTAFADTTTGVGEIGYAEEEALFSAIWNIGDLRLTWSGQYMTKGIDYAPDIIPAQWFHDMSGRYQVMTNLSVYGGVRNLTDNYVFVGQGLDQPTGWTTFPDVYDGLGRRFYVGARVEF